MATGLGQVTGGGGAGGVAGDGGAGGGVGAGKVEGVRRELGAVPGPAQALAGFAMVERWVRTGPVEEGREKDDVAMSYGASVTLRLDGVVVGRGQSLSRMRSTEHVRVATKAALDELRKRMDRNAGGGDGADGANGALGAFANARGKVAISLELAGEPAAVAVGSTMELEALLSPGIDGIAAVKREQIGQAGVRLAGVFPGQMLAGNSVGGGMTMGLAAGSVVAEVVGDATAAVGEPTDWTGKHGLLLLSFKAAKVVQRAWDVPAEILFRGQRVVSVGQVDSSKELWKFADELAGHLVIRQRGGWKDGKQTGIMPGALLMSSGEVVDEVSDPLDAALVAYALRVYDSTRRVAGANGPGIDTNGEMGQVAAMAVEAGPVSRAIVEELVRGGGKAKAWDDAISASMLLLVANDPMAFDDLTLRGNLALAGKMADGCRVVGANGDVKFVAGVPTGTEGLLALGQRYSKLVGLGERGGGLLGDVGERRRIVEESTKGVARGLVRETMSNLQPGTLITYMPWLGWGVLATGGDSGEQAELAGGALLREMRALTWGFQFGSADAGAEGVDLVGGIVMSGGGSGTRGSGPSLPTVQTVRPVAFFATMLGDERLTTRSERNGEIVRLLQAFRFLRQLQVDEGNVWMARDQGLALGGIRMSMTDNRLMLQSTSLTLVAVCQMLGSLRAIEEGGGGGGK